MFAPNVVLGLPQHSVDILSSHILFSKADSDHFLKFCNYADENDEMIEKIKKFRKEEAKPLIEIGNDVWIGYGAVIMQGVKIGDGAIIASCAVVTKDVEPYTVVGGIPAKYIRNRFDNAIRDELLRLKWWEYGPDIMKFIDMTNPKEAIKKLAEKIETAKKYNCYKVLVDGENRKISIVGK